MPETGYVTVITNKNFPFRFGTHVYYVTFLILLDNNFLCIKNRANVFLVCCAQILKLNGSYDKINRNLKIQYYWPFTEPQSNGKNPPVHREHVFLQFENLITLARNNIFHSEKLPGSYHSPL